ncbi:conserved protein of unknown function [Candidatus Promineifilum breve]|uniref:Uncharacterized protein n=1 Tax=Candidatus Promineifilum breve TaxID=1806508 RepID=A0A160T4R0_9CHLR|nr:DUF6516 family protein [Candidatus Promineifilum breve]CUS04088.2 conserved protein of unknown function [Candidatus Promineifilum breve]
MRLRHHLNLVFDILTSRQDLTVERLATEETIAHAEGIVEGRVRFWDGSMLEFVEVLVMRGLILTKIEYAYHYQDKDNRLIFRYDNAPHHPGISTFPHHKHSQQAVEAATPPHIGDVLREIDKFLYS